MDSVVQSITTFDIGSVRSPELQYAIAQVATAGIEERGAIFTRREVVEFILDLAGYCANADLVQTRLLEPSCGQGDFLVVALERLLESYAHNGGRVEDAGVALRDCIRAVELHLDTYYTIQARIHELLVAHGIPRAAADELITSWFLQDDFLLCQLPSSFTHVVGNPPYVRQERIPDILLSHYRARYKTIFDRADLYVPFIERGLQLLATQGRLAFICADRWMKNRYGGPLRSLIAKQYHLEYYVDMTDTDAFYAPVSAYPAIMVIANCKAPEKKTRVVHRPAIDNVSLQQLATRMTQSEPLSEPDILENSQVEKGAGPWILGATPTELGILRHLEQKFPLLEAVGCKVGIGVATGCDRVYIGQLKQLPVEPDRKLPLIMAPDIRSGHIEWSGTGIINPFTANGELVSLVDYPKLKAYFSEHESLIRKRNVAKRANSWYRTIDRIYPALVGTSKLLIPDIKGEANVVFDAGQYYPHHNLYYVTSIEWDLRALQAILRSTIAKLFITNYSVKMRGDFLRFQAQYIRRIHLPAWQDLTHDVKERLHQAALHCDWVAANDAAFDAYQLSIADRKHVLKTINE
jgi:hypothetical protein